MTSRRFVGMLALAGLLGCGGESKDEPAPAQDAAPDAQAVDAEIPDVAPPPPDVRPVDAEVQDAAIPDAALPDAAAPVAFSFDELQALFVARCSGCHVGGRLGDLNIGREDFRPSTVDVASVQLPSMDLIEPGDRERSYLYLKVAGRHLEVGGSGQRMPTGGMLPEADVERLGLYIDALEPTPPAEVCVGGLDDDADGATDCADTDCAAAAECLTEECGNGLDDDLDMRLDCDDPDCIGAGPCNDEDCANGVDDDGDAVVDCADADCVALAVCNPELCADTADNDGDGFSDCDDDDCLPDPACAGPMPEGEIQQLFNGRCAGCHVGGASLGGLSLDVPFAARTVGVPANVGVLNRIEPGDRMRSFLWHKINGSQANVGGGARMPRGGMLNEIQIERIGRYIDALPPFVPMEVCGNFRDDDADGDTDCDDVDCALSPACLPEVCDDGLDNDGDFLIDCVDDGCAGAEGCAPGEVCDNGRDDDGDLQADCADVDCAPFPGCQPEDCANGLDDNGNGRTDCGDALCDLDPACAIEDCANGRDDDANGEIDCLDEACINEPVCLEDCRNNVDDNGNALIDCEDPSCDRAVICQREDCGDRIDNNADGLVDCFDADCAGVGACGDEDCTNGVDDNADGDADCFDDQCTLDVACVQPYTTDELAPILSRGCGCHSNSFLRAPFTNGTVNVRAPRGGGLDFIEPGNPQASFLYLKIAGQQGPGAGNRMPQGGPFWNDVDIARLAAWITNYVP